MLCIVLYKYFVAVVIYPPICRYILSKSKISIWNKWLRIGKLTFSGSIYIKVMIFQYNKNIQLLLSFLWWETYGKKITSNFHIDCICSHDELSWNTFFFHKIIIKNEFGRRWSGKNKMKFCFVLTDCFSSRCDSGNARAHIFKSWQKYSLGEFILSLSFLSCRHDVTIL